MTGLPDKAPPGWAKDGLTAFLDLTRRNQYATFRNHPKTKRIVEIDALFVKVLDKPINPRPLLPMLFMLRAHASWRAAAGGAMAGQFYETNATLRSSIETSAYGVFIGDDENLFELWMSRHHKPENRQKVKNAFAARKVSDNIRTMSKSLASDYESLYERLIDLGAHPNERGFTYNRNLQDRGTHRYFEQVYLHAEGPQLDLALENVAKAGMWVLHLFRLVYSAKFELLGVSATLDELRKDPI